MKIKRHINDSFFETLKRLHIYFPNMIEALGASEVGIKNLRIITANAQKVMRYVREHTIMMVQGTEDEAEYMARVETCEAYVKILERNVAMLDAGQPINVLDCVVATTAYYLQEKAIQATIDIQGQSQMATVSQSEPVSV
jgi:hypothetical protein